MVFTCEKKLQQVHVQFQKFLNLFYKSNDFVIPKEMEQYLKTHWEKMGWYFSIIYQKV